MAANVALRLSNTPENVELVRTALAGLAELLGLEALEAGDLDTAVTEACRNVVLHAYDGGEGPLEVEFLALEEAVEVLVRDRGLGIRPHPGERTQPHTGIGLPMIHALTDVLTFRKLPGGGTEVRLRFLAPTSAPIGPLQTGGSEIAAVEDPRGGRALEMTLAPEVLARALLPRILAALAARLALSAELIAALAQLAEALMTGAGEESIGDRRAAVERTGANRRVLLCKRGSALLIGVEGRL